MAKSSIAGKVALVFFVMGLFAACSTDSQEKECTPSTSACVSEKTFKYCTVYGLWAKPESCPVGTACIGDKCVSDSETNEDGDSEATGTTCAGTCVAELTPSKCINGGKDVCVCDVMLWQPINCASFCAGKESLSKGCGYEPLKTMDYCLCENGDSPDGDREFEVDALEGESEEESTEADGDSEEPYCDPKADYGCSGGDVYYSDCHGTQTELKEDCLECGCSGGTCQYNSHAYAKCYDNDVYWFDCRKIRGEKKQDCGTGGCANGSCVGTPFACEGEVCTDPSTGLQWQKTVIHPAQPEYWSFAAESCQKLDLQGKGWRLPNISELRTLIRGCPAMSTGGECAVTDVCTQCGVAAGQECLSFYDCYTNEGNLCLAGCSQLTGPGYKGCYLPSELSCFDSNGAALFKTISASPFNLQGANNASIKYRYDLNFSNGAISYTLEETKANFLIRCVR